MRGAKASPDGALTELDAAALRRWAVLVRAALAARRAEIDDLNVFPVPDGDTGTNLFLTVDGAFDRNDATPVRDGAGEGDASEAGDLLGRFASALLWAARGNSGVILSQLVRGIAEAARGRNRLDASDLARGLKRADEMAWHAVTQPQEGTILSVSRAAADAGGGAVERGLHAVAAVACTAAAEALARTPEQLPVLAEAGVVDAGAAGYVIVLECLERVCAGDEGLSTARVSHTARHPRNTQPDQGVHLTEAFRPSTCEQAAADDSGVAHRTTRHPTLASNQAAFEVMYLLADSSDGQVERLRDRLVELGDSVLVVGGDGEWNVHVHVVEVADAGAAVEAGIEAGRPHRVRISGLDHQGRRAPSQSASAASAASADGGQRTASAIVACVAGPGLIALFREAGAEVVRSAPGRRASTGQILEAIRAQHAAGAGSVVVLPGDRDTELAAGAAVQAAIDEGLDAHVVRSRATVQSVAALAVFEPGSPAAANVLAMQSAASATRHGAVTTATRSALTSVGPCEAGDVLGLVDGDIAVIGRGDQSEDGEPRTSREHEVTQLVVERLLSSGGELLTVLVGADAPSALADTVRRAARQSHLGLDVSVIDGGQPVYTVLLGVE